MIHCESLAVINRLNAVVWLWLRYFPVLRWRDSHTEKEKKKNQKERKREKEISDDIACVKMFEFGTLLLKIRINNQTRKRLWNVLLRYAIFLRSCWSFGRMIGPTNCISNPVSFHSQKSMAICPFCSLCVFTSFSWFDSIHQKKKNPQLYRGFEIPLDMKCVHIE